MAVEKRKERLSDILTKQDYEMWSIRFLWLRTKIIIYLLVAKQDAFLTDKDRLMYERFRNCQRARRNSIYWRGADAVIMESTDNVVALRHLRESDTATMTRRADALYHRAE